MYIALNPDQKWRNQSDRCNYRLLMMNAALLLHAILKASHCRLHTRESILHLINANSQFLQNLILPIARNTSFVQIVSTFFSVNVCVAWCLAKQPTGFICAYGLIYCACAIAAIRKLLLSSIIFHKNNQCFFNGVGMNSNTVAQFINIDIFNMQKNENDIKMTVMFQHKVSVS